MPNGFPQSDYTITSGEQPFTLILDFSILPLGKLPMLCQLPQAYKGLITHDWAIIRLGIVASLHALYSDGRKLFKAVESPQEGFTVLAQGWGDVRVDDLKRLVIDVFERETSLTAS